MQKLFDDAGLPDGAFNNLFAPISATEHILAHPLVRGVALTGSERAGTAVGAAAGRNLKKSTLELGGADAFIVLDDADIDKTVAWAVFGRHWNAGQVCVSAKRLIIADAVYDEFMGKYRAGVTALLAGDPLDPATQLAPLSTQKAGDNLAAEVTMAIAGGATAETLGKPVPTQGSFFQPTILTDVTPDNPAFQTEFFGPVSMVFRVADEDEAVAVANASRYGLGGSVFSRDTARGERVGSTPAWSSSTTRPPSRPTSRSAASRCPATATSSPSSASASSSPTRSSTSSTSTPRSDPPSSSGMPSHHRRACRLRR
jgi:succinate-semialdehyde dehydrogenase/glutarate-semialdehyde dehydrogenase